MSTIAIEKAYVHSVEHKSISREEGAQPRDLAVLRVLVDRAFRQGENDDGSPRYNRDRNFWINAQIWGPRAKTIVDVVTNGAVILMVGRYDNHRWEDDTNTMRDGYVFQANQIAVLPFCVSSITYRSQEGKRDGQASQPQAPVMDDYDDDIPY